MMAVALVALILAAYLGVWALCSVAAREPDWQASFEVDLDDPIDEEEL